MDGTKTDRVHRRRFFEMRSRRQESLFIKNLLIALLAFIAGIFFTHFTIRPILALGEGTSGAGGFISSLAVAVALTLLPVGAVVLAAIVISRQTAGPLDKIQRTIEQLALTTRPQTITLRRGDEFQDLAYALNDALDGLIRRDPNIWPETDSNAEREDELSRPQASPPPSRRTQLLAYSRHSRV